MKKDRQIVFIHIPKTAGISFIKTYENENIKVWGHDTRQDWYRFFPNNPQTFYSKYLPFLAKEHYFAFAVVRNTWDRLFSAYTYLSKGGGNLDDATEAEIYVKPYKDFEDFVLNGLETASQKQLHFYPQTVWFCNKKGISVANRILHFENLEEDVKTLMSELNIQYRPLPHHNKSHDKNYKDCYSPKMVQKVAEIYKDEIKKLNYKF